ncbi:hypothetical protein GCM10011581_30260 [Saccharopolyspora subtropica]|uniref:Uncharacterized protein n=1 Tax=Saccharopolyspora thermophila TaxID=89367 RepID=A0A917JX90_9PSEU|nr:hypothetical protein [Saccharopolyspora subtropica]GGI91167.1 hypothetical protein GCM10011581_30260 [Saccharopolyspora subtropica]
MRTTVRALVGLALAASAASGAVGTATAATVNSSSIPVPHAVQPHAHPGVIAVQKDDDHHAGDKKNDHKAGDRDNHPDSRSKGGNGKVG